MQIARARRGQEEAAGFKLQVELASCMSAASVDVAATQEALQDAEKAAKQARDPLLWRAVSDQRTPLFMWCFHTGDGSTLRFGTRSTGSVCMHMTACPVVCSWMAC